VRNGLRLGAGRRGRGLYCVPLFELRYPDQVNWNWPPASRARRPLSEPRSSAHLWRWMGAGAAHRRHTAVVVFEALAAAWPADLYLLAPGRRGRAMVSLARELELEFEREPPQLDYRAGRWGGAAAAIPGDLRVCVPNVRALGRLLAAFKPRIEASADLYEHLTALELVFRAPQPARCIRKVVPLYPTSRRGQERRSRIETADE
jgi:hypothetical protein